MLNYMKSSVFLKTNCGYQLTRSIDETNFVVASVLKVNANEVLPNHYDALENVAG